MRVVYIFVISDTSLRNNSVNINELEESENLGNETSA